MLPAMKAALGVLGAGVWAGLAASAFVNARGLTDATGDSWPLVLAVFAYGAALTLAVLLAAWRIGLGRADGWWPAAMDGLSTATYLALVAALLYGLGVTGYEVWSSRGRGLSPAGLASVAGATFLFFFTVLHAAVRSLSIALRR